MSARSILAVICLVNTIVVTARADEPAKNARIAGRTDDGFLLPNGWTLSPAGEQVTLTDMPLGIVPLADNRRALVASSGYNQHEL